MKTTITFLKAALIMLLMAFQNEAFAQTYYDLYLHNGTSGTLRPTVATTFAAGDQVIWTETYNGTTTDLPAVVATTPNLTVSTTTHSPGLHTFTMKVRSLAGCDSEPSDAITVYILPATTLAFDADPTVLAYCENDATHTSVLNATATPASALPDGIGYTYTWTVQKTVGATTTTPVLSDVGSASSSNGATTSFTMNTTSVGAYQFSVKAVYFKLTGNTGTVNLGTPALDFATAGTKTVTVNKQPGKPGIQIL